MKTELRPHPSKPQTFFYKITRANGFWVVAFGSREDLDDGDPELAARVRCILAMRRLYAEKF